MLIAKSIKQAAADSQLVKARWTWHAGLVEVRVDSGFLIMYFKRLGFQILASRFFVCSIHIKHDHFILPAATNSVALSVCSYRFILFLKAAESG